MSDNVLQTLIQSYGYWAVLFGTFIEGETVLLLGGLAAHRGYLELPWVMLTAFVGSLLGDQLYFYLGRRHGTTMLAKHPAWTPRVERTQQLIERYHTPLILGIRFMIGLRTIGPFVMGMSNLPVGRFVVLNAIGAALWAITISLLGYLLGNALTALLGTIKHIELEVFGAIAVLGFAIWLILLWRRRAPVRKTPD